MKTLNELRDEIHENAKNKGFWDSPREAGIHSILSNWLSGEARRGDSDNMTFTFRNPK